LYVIAGDTQVVNIIHRVLAIRAREDMFSGLIEFVIIAENICIKHVFQRRVRVIRVDARHKFLSARDKVVRG